MINKDLTIHCLNQSYNLEIMEVRPTLDSCSDRMEKHRIHLRYKLGRLDYEVCDVCQTVVITEHLDRSTSDAAAEPKHE
jgi:hypothetical protein